VYFEGDCFGDAALGDDCAGQRDGLAAGAQASTFGGNPVCVAASLVTVRLIESQYMENARRLG